MKRKLHSKEIAKEQARAHLNEQKPAQKQKPGKKIAPMLILTISIALSTFVYFFSDNKANSVVVFIAALLFLSVYMFAREKLKESIKIKKMEEVFPDFIELVASNLRAGMTMDKALLLSSRKEFNPLDQEILFLGKEIITGKEIIVALKDMAIRIKSDKIRKTVELIISGIRSGGNISILLEETAINMRERNFIEKKSASNVLMYVIFIFFAVAIGAPLLFGLSSVLVQIMTKLVSTIPISQVTSSMPFTFSKVNISSEFITYFAIMFLAVTDILASMIIGIVNKGNEKSGLKYALPLIAVSIVVFFVIKSLMISYFASFFS